jgi:hypothetical protein
LSHSYANLPIPNIKSPESKLYPNNEGFMTNVDVLTPSVVKLTIADFSIKFPFAKKVKLSTLVAGNPSGAVSQGLVNITVVVFTKMACNCLLVDRYVNVAGFNVPVDILYTILTESFTSALFALVPDALAAVLAVSVPLVVSSPNTSFDSP